MPSFILIPDGLSYSVSGSSQLGGHLVANPSQRRVYAVFLRDLCDFVVYFLALILEATIFKMLF